MRTIVTSMLFILVVTACASPERRVPPNGFAQITKPVYRSHGTPFEEFVGQIGDRVYFETGSARLNTEAMLTLARQAQWLKARSHYRVVIEGHCDERGTREYNLALGMARAQATQAFLAGQGLDTRRMEVRSFGKERPVTLGSNEAAWQLNRRSVTVLQ